MSPTFYVDYSVNAELKPSMAEVSQGTAALFKALHAAFSEMPGSFAIDFPLIESKNPVRRLRVIRVFSEKAEEHNFISEFLEQSGLTGRLQRSEQIKSVPKNFTGPYRILRRIRIRGRDRAVERLQMMQKLEQQGNIWLPMRSSENRNSFRFYFDYTTVDEAQPSGNPSNYGMSIGSDPVFIPVVY